MIILLIVMTGLMAGIYFSFSVFIMKSLAQLPAMQAAQAMNKINDVIVNTSFLPVFFITTLWYAGLIVWSFASWQGQQSMWVIAVAVIYVLGMFGVTAFGNVPLNNQLKAQEANPAMLQQVWQEYLRRWTRLNHLRTLSCMLACALLAAAHIY